MKNIRDINLYMNRSIEGLGLIIAIILMVLLTVHWSFAIFVVIIVMSRIYYKTFQCVI